MADERNTNSSSVIYDPFFGIRVQNLKLSPNTFQNYVGIRQKVRINDMRPELLNVNWDDWVTMGVLVDKTPLKTAASGCQFFIWKLSDLIDCQKIIRVLLFGDSSKTSWKLSKGDVVALLNASKMENKPGSFPTETKAALTLKIDSTQKIVEIGSCPDYGQCKGIRKQDNLHCTNFVNRSKSDFCDFHLIAASKQLASKRGEFQLSSNVPPKKFNNPIRKVLGGGNQRTQKLSWTNGINAFATPVSGSGKTNLMNVKCNENGALVSGNDKATVSIQGPDDKVSVKESVRLQAVLHVNTAGSRQVLGQLSKMDTSKHSSNASNATRLKVTCRQFLANQKRTGKASSNVLEELKKAKAAAIIRNNKNKTQKAAIGDKRPLDTMPKLGKHVLARDGLDGPLAKRPRLGQISNLSKQRLQELANKKSSHEAELNEDDAQKQEEYFKFMEAKEKVEQRATEVMSLQSCKVVTCKICNYTWHAQSSLCKKNAHDVHWHLAEKRFFKCKSCKKRTISYQKYPIKPCDCGSTTYNRVAMRDESKGPLLGGETLKIRGDEEPFANS